MKCGFIIVVIFLFTKNVLSDTDDIVQLHTETDIPAVYLEPENVVPTVKDLEHYIVNLKHIVDYLNKYPNDTDCNIALTCFYTKSILKRTLLDERNKLRNQHVVSLTGIIHGVENIVSHYIYNNMDYDWDDMEYRVSKLFHDDTPVLHSIGKFSRNTLKPFILSKEKINNFVDDMDKAILPTQQYAKLVAMMAQEYNIRIMDSDFCISSIAYNPEPIDISKIHACQPEEFCEKRLLSGASVAYTLSHRLLNMILRLNVKRCYIKSEEEDFALIDKLCGFMYREAVYIFRRGYFARDMFLEHIALCSVMGYEEFHRREWFYKATDWINEYGCISESKSFRMEYAAQLVKYAGKDLKRKQELVQQQCESLLMECHDHPTTLLATVLSHAIRHAAHFMKS